MSEDNENNTIDGSSKFTVAAVAISALIIGGAGGKLIDGEIDQAAIEQTIVEQGFIAPPESIDSLAVSTDKIKIGNVEYFTKPDPNDSTKTIQDSHVTPTRAVIDKCDDNGIANYEIAKIIKAGSKARIILEIDGEAQDAMEISPNTYNFLVSIRPRFTQTN